MGLYIDTIDPFKGQQVEFAKSLLEFNDKVVSLKFNFRRPSLYGNIVYKTDLEKEDFQYLIDDFKTFYMVQYF